MTRAPDTLERHARRRVGMKLGFYTHAMVYVLVNAGLFALDALTGPHGWSRWPLMGWGLGLAIHGLVTFVGLGAGGLRERMLQAERAALRRSQGGA